MQAVFDGHNDVLLRLWRNASAGADPVAEFTQGTSAGHIDLPRARAGGLAGGICAIYVPNPSPAGRRRVERNGHYETPMADPLERAPSLDVSLAMASIAHRLDRAGAWRLCRSVADIRDAMGGGEFAAVLHIEGCEGIGPDLSALDVFHAAGLRSLGPVWSRHNIFGHGVPFAYPMSPDTGPGLTEAGRDLVRACDRLGIAVDLSHITEQGFWDVAEVSRKPLIASHSNAHELTPVARNLTDRQLDAIRERRGLVGLNFAVSMLRGDGRESTETPLSDMVRHLDYLVRRVGIECVGLGSDFDGAAIPREIGDAAGLPRLVNALRDAGFGEPELALVCRENWLRVLGEVWGG